jgi:hypothetical protein
MKMIFALVAMLLLASCTAPVPRSWEGTPNPLDPPGGGFARTPISGPNWYR